MSILDTLEAATEGEAADITLATEGVGEGFDEDKVPELVDEIFTEAIKKHASDIHFKPLDDNLVVYFRIDGQMILYKEFEKIYHHPIVARIKIISGLKIDEHRLPQDGKSAFTVKADADGGVEVEVKSAEEPKDEEKSADPESPESMPDQGLGSEEAPTVASEEAKAKEGRSILAADNKSKETTKIEKEVDLRVSILPTSFGEKVVIRLLEKSPGLVTLQDLGVLPNILMKIDKHLESSYGMILAVGPTGSGKSTSLFSMISTFDASKFNISTLEDPIEYQIPHVTQTQINPDIGLDFSDGLRSLVRQDPDIIMVGEVRDHDTAALAIESALTGHLVFSTLHTNTAVGTIQRLLNMEIDRFLISAAVKLIISQRLARKICNYCREGYPVPKAYHDLLRKETDVNPEEAFFYKSKGCEKCNNTGYKGRIGLFEVLEVTPEIEELIVTDASNSDIEDKAVEQGMILLRKDALYKAITGDITIEEALRIMA